jgi:hypothetical protein
VRTEHGGTQAGYDLRSPAVQFFNRLGCSLRASSLKRICYEHERIDVVDDCSKPVRPADVYDIRDVARAGASDISVREVLMSIKQDLRDFIECYFPASKFKRAWQNAIAFFAPEDAKVELEALDYTIADLERQRRIIGLQLSFLRLERARKMQEIK